MGSHNRVLVLLDATNEAFDALDQAIDLAGHSGEVLALQIRREPSTDSEWIRNAMHADPSEVEAHATVRDRLSEARYRNVQVVVEQGDTVNAIVRTADTSNCDLIVLPRRQEARLRNALRGSLVDRVTRSTTRPVFVSGRLQAG